MSAGFRPKEGSFLWWAWEFLCLFLSLAVVYAVIVALASLWLAVMLSI